MNLHRALKLDPPAARRGYVSLAGRVGAWLLLGAFFLQAQIVTSITLTPKQIDPRYHVTFNHQNGKRAIVSTRRSSGSSWQVYQTFPPPNIPSGPAWPQEQVVVVILTNYVAGMQAKVDFR